MKKNNKKGKLIVIEGIDGSGKGTQSKLVIERLQSMGFIVGTLDYPRYESESTYFVKKYLNGEYGEVSGEAASLFYALDRFDDKVRIERLLEHCDFVISNRYTTSNMIHQGSKALEEDGDYVSMVDYIIKSEYDILGIPKPDITLFLNINHETSKELLKKKEQRDYINDKSKNTDIHESNENHLKYAYQTGINICSSVILNGPNFFGNWELINCYNENSRKKDPIGGLQLDHQVFGKIDDLLTIDEITNKIISVITDK